MDSDSGYSALSKQVHENGQVATVVVTITERRRYTGFEGSLDSAWKGDGMEV